MFWRSPVEKGNAEVGGGSLIVAIKKNTGDMRAIIYGNETVVRRRTELWKRLEVGSRPDGGGCVGRPTNDPEGVPMEGGILQFVVRYGQKVGVAHQSTARLGSSLDLGISRRYRTST